MVDPGLITILFGGTQVQAAGSSPPSGSATSNIPALLQNIQPGTVLSGLVVRNDPNGNTIIKTDRGEVAIRSNIFLRYGNEIVIRFDAAGNTPRARIISIDGLTPQQFAALGAPALSDDFVETSQIAGSTLPPNIPSAPGSGAAAAPAVFNSTALFLKAIFLAPPSQNAPSSAPAATPSPLIPGNNLQLKISLGTPTAESNSTIQNLSARYADLPPGKQVLPENMELRLTPGAASPAATAPVANTAVKAVVPLPGQTPSPNATLPLTPQTGATVPSSSPTLAYSASGAALQKPSLTPEQTRASIISNPEQALGSLKPLAQETVRQAIALSSSAAAGKSAPIASNPSANAQNPQAPATTQAIQTPSQSPVAATATSPGLTQTATASLSTVLPQTGTAQPLPQGGSLTAPSPLPGQFVQVDKQTGETAVTKFTGTIIARESSGDIVVRTPIGIIKLLPESLSGLAQLPVGTNFNIELLSSDLPLRPATAATPLIPAPLTSLPPSLDALLRLSGGWPTLQDITHWARANAGQNPAILRELSDRIIPRLDARMTSGIIFFLAAVRGGDARQWLGQKVSSALEQAGRGDLIQRLSGEFTLLRGLLADAPANPPPPGQWQPLFVPVMYEGMLSQLRFYVKKEKSKDQKRKQDDTRFVLELELSEMGDLQLDGFVRKQKDSTSVDMILRSLRRLDAEQEQDIRVIFAEAAEVTGFKGDLQFQVVKSFPVRPLEELLAAHSHSISA